MRVQVYVGLGTQRKMIWDGILDHLPRVGEDIVLPKSADDWSDRRVDRIKHYLPTGRRGAGHIEIYVR